MVKRSYTFLLFLVYERLLDESNVGFVITIRLLKPYQRDVMVRLMIIFMVQLWVGLIRPKEK